MQLESSKVKSIISSLNWVLGQQNRDGSWGGSQIEKIRWTSNALLTFHEIGFSPEYTPIAKGLNWLKTYSRNQDEWYLKIPPLLALGFQNELVNNGDIDALKQKITNDQIGVLTFKVSLILDLHRHNINYEGIDKIEQSILNTYKDEGNNLSSFSSSTNATSLYCEFLSVFYKDKHKEIIDKCVQWVLIRKIKSSQNNTICWDKSYGKTAYVLINLLTVAKEEGSKLISPVLSYFEPDKYGAIPKDVTPAVKSTSSIYTTILFVRLTAVIANSNQLIYKTLFTEKCKQTSLFQFKYRKLKSILKLSGLFILFLLPSGILINQYFTSTLREGIIASLIAAAIAAAITWFLSSIRTSTKN